MPGTLYPLVPRPGGGDERMAKRSMGVSDFPKTGLEDFDRRAPRPDPAHQGKRPAWAKTMAVWAYDAGLQACRAEDQDSGRAPQKGSKEGGGIGTARALSTARSASSSSRTGAGRV